PVQYHTVRVTFKTDSNLVAGTYDFQLFGEALNQFDDLDITVNVIEEAPQVGPVLMAPNNAIGSGTELQPALTWVEPAADLSYEIEIAADPAFTNIVETAIGVVGNYYEMASALSPFTTYYWRVRGMNICGEGPFEVSAFQTGNCADFVGANLPRNINPFGAPSTVSSSVNVGLSGAVTDVNVVNLKGTHASINDLEFKLISPDGTEVVLANAICGDNNAAFDLSFDDDAQSSDPECPLVGAQTLAPEEALSVFVGEQAGGTWTLEIADNVNFNGGEWTGWGLQLCVNGAQVVPEVLRNDTLFTTQWYAADISQALLEASDIVSTPEQLSFTLLTMPGHGGVLLNGSNLNIGDSFTQKDINDGNVSYLHNGDNALADEFVFSVTNFIGGWTGTPTFNIQIATNTSVDPEAKRWELQAFPNPATDQLQLRTDLTGMATQVRLFDGQGRIVRQGKLHESLQWSLQGLAAGLYLLEAENDLGRQTRKVLIRR
ncbi:MAG: cadherin-like domain-containing protein, partial [Bacteroidota bacterium]